MRRNPRTSAPPRERRDREWQKLEAKGLVQGSERPYQDAPERPSEDRPTITDTLSALGQGAGPEEA